jgi:glutathione peroxidase
MKRLASLAFLLLAPMTAPAQSLFEIPLKDIDGHAASLAAYQGRVLLIVNVASECGYTRQYRGLQAVFATYQAKGLTVLGFPCNQFGGQEPGTNPEIKNFCTTKFHVSFPLYDKIDVNGPQRHALYAALAGKNSPFPGDITWNFNKFLIGRDGTILARFDSAVEPDSAAVTRAIETALAAR